MIMTAKEVTLAMRMIISCCLRPIRHPDGLRQGWQSVGSIRFPDLIPTEISGIGSCSDPEINFYSQIGSGSFLVVQIIGRDRSKLKVYPEFIGHLKFYKLNGICAD